MELSWIHKPKTRDSASVWRLLLKLTLVLRYAVLLWRVLSSRAVKVLLYLWILAWGLDRAIFWATEAAWFASVGQSAWFGVRFWTQFGLFWATFGGALVTAALTMRIAAKPAPGAELRVLPSALETLEPLRRVATRLAWLVLIVGAWGVARQMAGGWSVVLAARAGQISDPIWGLPLARLALSGLWEWTLLLLGALAFAGGLRALPVLAQREPLPPLRLWRALSVLGVLALLTRGAIYVVALGEANWSDGTTGAELFIDLPLRITGVVLCALAAFWCVKRPSYKRLGVAVAAALFAPHLLRLLLAPLSLIVPTPAAIEARNRANTAVAWNLDKAAGIAATAPPLASHWPIWNEEALLGLTRAEMPRRGQQIIDWKRATIGTPAAIVAGVPATLDNWGSPHDADVANGIEWLAFDVTKSVEGRAPLVPDEPLPLRSFYGIAGRHLLGDNTSDAGVPFGFWGWKVAWAWRLRDPLLMLEGARAQRLLVFRGARESAERLAPFLTWDEAQLRMTANGPRWELVGYAATPYYHYRGALAVGEGVFANDNAAQAVVITHVEPRNGRVDFLRANGASWGAVWLRSMGASNAQTAPETPLLDEARAHVARRLGRKNGLNEAVWTWSNGRAARARYAPQLPVGADERLAVLDAAARREWTREENAQLQMGDAVLWPAARAPGGFWVGRPYYVTTAAPGVASQGGIAQSAKLWRVSLTGLTDSPLAHGDDANAALVNFDLQTAPPAVITSGQTPVDNNALALRALRAHDAAQKAANASNWAEWSKQSALERQLLEQLAAHDGKR